ncbi:uncharacterized protein [Procambarus clarkii]|uniref:uncharacterized protein isoform X2 n=1 Tax=Procambarus clarkii TaxID=6728 RepID=UPI00374219EC
MTWDSVLNSCVAASLTVTTTTPAPVTFSDPLLVLYNRWDSQVQVWYCNSLSYGVENNTRMVMALPGDPMWNTPGSCNHTIDVQSCSAPAPYLAGAKVVQNFTWNSTTVYGVYYECNDGLQMISGYPGRLTQCVGGQWTTIFDVCIEEYCPQRDCCVLAALNYTNNNGTQYMVAPSAYRDNNSIPVICDLGSTVRDKEGGWTLVLNHSTADNVTLHMTQSGYIQGGGVPQSTSYFIGLWALTALNWDGSKQRPLVMKIMMKDMSDNTLHATYGRLVVSPNNYTLSSLGTYHGNTGDHLTGSVGNTFCPVRDPSNMDPCWWGDPSTPNSGLLTGDKPTWGSVSLKSLNVWVRSLDCDKGLACPPLNTAINLANESYVPVSRAPGISFQYICPGDLMMTGTLGSSSKSPQGQVKCLPNTAYNQTPTWDVVFPCVLVCPTDYVMSVNGSTCYNFSSDEKSHTDALTSCALKNSTLAFLNNPQDMKRLPDNNTFYLTAYTLTRDTQIFPYLRTWEDHGFYCTQKYHWCPTGGQENCFILHRAGYFNVSYCQINNRYICQRPAMCPPGYTLYKSRCYKLLTPSATNTTFLNALDHCNYDGSALAYPQNLDALNFLKIFAKQEVNWSSQASVNIAVGYTNLWDDLTVAKIYTPDADITALVQNLNRAQDFNYTYLSVNNSGQGGLTPANVNSTVTYALCEFRGPLGCWEWYPPYENMSVRGILGGSIINQTLEYSCWPGFFVNADVGNKTKQYLWCHGQLGGWFPRHPPLIPCIGVDVCNETLPPIPPNMTQHLGDHPRYETYSVSYSCQSDDMTNMDGEHTQVLTCTEYNGTYAYDRTNVTACNRCFKAPSLSFANTTFASKTVWVIGDQANATCDPSYQVAHNVTQQLVNCTISGWQMLPCQRVCLEVPNVTNATTNWVDDMWTVSENVTANCLGNLYFPKLNSQTRPVYCTQNGWDNTPICMQVCLRNPVVQNATVDLQNVMWAVGEAPTATCSQHYMFLPEATKTQPIMCTSQGWQNRTGCVPVCDQPPSVSNAITAWTSSSVYPVGSTVNGSCNSGAVIMPSGNQQFTIQCTSNGWTTNSCQKVCSLEPQVVNATTNWTNGLWPVGSAVNATCLGNLTFITVRSSSRLVSCTSTGWQNTPSCDELKPSLLCNVEPKVDNATTSWENRTWGVGNIITATCSFPLYYFNDSTQQHQLECTKDGWENITGCSKLASVNCRQEPEVNNTNSTWVDRDWYVGENVTVTCIPDHWFISEDTDHLQVNCTWDGWTNLTGCEKVNIGKQCSVVPLVENATTTWRNRTWFVGDNVTATCLPGFIFVANNASQSPVTCTAQGWQNLTGCQIVCEEEPSVEGAMTDWSSTVVWPLGATVNATCLQGHYILPEGNLTQTVECTSQGWQNVTRCEPGCAEELALEAANGSAIWKREVRVWWLDENLTASCSDQYLTHDGTNTTNFTCTPTGWLILAPCLRVCEGKPSVDNGSTTWVPGLWLEGQEVMAHCNPQYRFQNQTSSLTLACTNTGWQNITGCTFFFTCLMIP